jgi:hypothetical protein
MHRELKSESLEGRDNCGDLGADGRDVLRYILRKQSVKTWTGFKWLWIESSGGFL